MCGIIGYVGERPALPILIAGLKRMEYRGYDSAGVALHEPHGLTVVKAEGKISNLEAVLRSGAYEATLGIGHTRWATHGPPTQDNAHPHTDESGDLALVHNGIIENFQFLRRYLKEQGIEPRTETDTEVLAHLIAHYYEGSVEQAVRRALSIVEGTYGIAVMHRDHPRKLVGARNGSPMVVGIGENEFFLASDVAAILAHTRQVIYLDDHEMVVIEDGKFHTKTIRNEMVEKSVHEVTWDLESIEKGGYEHFMLKEIFEQPNTIRNSFRGRLILDEGKAKLGGLIYNLDDLRAADRIIFLACGTSWHAALIGEYMHRATWRASPWKSSTPPSSATATPSSPSRTSPGRSASPARRWTPWPPCARRAPRAPRRWAWSTWWAAPSPARATAASTSTRGRRSAWPPPRPSPAR